MKRTLLPILLVTCISTVARANPRVETAMLTPEKLVESIEGMTLYEARGIGFAGAPGKTYRALSALAQLGSAGRSFLAQLTRSNNPVARVAGIVGLGLQGEASGQNLIEHLLNDTEALDVFEGCIRGQSTVSTYARRILKRVYKATLPTVLQKQKTP